MTVLYSSQPWCWSQSHRLSSGKPVTLLYSSDFQTAFTGDSGSCSHESEAEGNGEKNRGRRKFSRWDLGFLLLINHNSSAAVCLIKAGLVVFAKRVLPLQKVGNPLIYNHRVLLNMPARCCIKETTNEKIFMLIG